MTKIKALNAFQWFEEYSFWILVPLLFGTALLWTYGLGGWQNFFTGLFYALQFIVLNKDLELPNNKTFPCEYVQYGLQFAQFAVPFTASVAFFGTLFHEQIKPFWRKRVTRGLDRHHVVVGHGAVGKALSASISRRQNVVVIDKLANEHLDSARLIQLQQDALSPALFDVANLGKAQCIYLLLPDERDNLTILASLASLASRSLAKDVTIFVRAESNDFRRLLADWVWLKNWMPEQKLDVRPINLYDAAARGIVNEFSPDIFAPTDKEGDIAQTIMVVGVSDMAEALILRFARLGVYSPEGKLRLIWAGRGVTDALAVMADSYPALKPDDHPDRHWGRPTDISNEFFRQMISSIEIVTVDFPAADAVRDNRLSNKCGKQWPSVIYVCHNSDIQNAMESRDLQAALYTHLPSCDTPLSKQRLILAIQNHAAIGIAQAEQSFPLSVFPYRIQEICIDTLFAETVVSDRADDLAKRFDAVWSEHEAVDPVVWNASPFFLKEMNRDPADHAAIKARFAGISAEKVSACFLDGLENLAPDDLLKLEFHHDSLALMEMRRYRAFMFMHGFSHGNPCVGDEELMKIFCLHPVDGETSPSNASEEAKAWKKLAKHFDRSRKINETLLDEKLSADQKIKDSDIVKVTMWALQMASPVSTGCSSKKSLK